MLPGKVMMFPLPLVPLDVIAAFPKLRVLLVRVAVPVNVDVVLHVKVLQVKAPVSVSDVQLKVPHERAPLVVIVLVPHAIGPFKLMVAPL